MLLKIGVRIYMHCIYVYLFCSTIRNEMFSMRWKTDGKPA